MFKIDNNVDRNLLLVNVEDPLRKGTWKLKEKSNMCPFLKNPVRKLIGFPWLDAFANSTNEEVTQMDSFTEQKNHHATKSLQPDSNSSLFYERMITDLKSRIAKSDIYFHKGTKFLRKQL